MRPKCHFLLSAIFLGAALSFSGVKAQSGNTQMSQCAYLKSSRSRWNPRMPILEPFKIYTRSRAPAVTSGKPVEVTVGPNNPLMNFVNFTDFIVYAEPVINQNIEFEFFGSGPRNPHLGVFQVFGAWAPGATTFSCNMRSRAEDSVGAYDERLITQLRQYYPQNPWIQSYRPVSRNMMSVLWWPTKEALSYPEIRFVANVKSEQHWFKMYSTPWRVNRPVDHWARTERMLSQLQAFQANMNAFERKMDQPV